MDSLIPKSRRPKRLRRMMISSENVRIVPDLTIRRIIKRYNFRLPLSSPNCYNSENKWAKRKIENITGRILRLSLMLIA